MFKSLICVLWKASLSIFVFVIFTTSSFAQQLPDSLKQEEKKAFADTILQRNEERRISDSLNKIGRPRNIKSIFASDSAAIPYPNPKRAGLLSSLVPGAGQLYNKQYWKLPLVYGGLGVAGYFIYTNNKNYKAFRKAYIARIDGDPDTRDEFEEIYANAESLRQRQEYFKKYLDLSVLITGLGYTLQILDAITFAYLHDFDVSKDISLRMKPQLQVLPNTQSFSSLGYGLAIQVQLK